MGFGEKKVAAMPNKSVILTIVATALLFGVVGSGCNRSRNDQVAAANRKKPDSQRHDAARGVRPAEVLSVSVRRSQRQSGHTEVAAASYASVSAPQPQPYYSSQSYSEPAYAEHVYVQSGNLAQYEPLPEPIPIPSTASYQYQTQYSTEYLAQAPVQASAASYTTPELALAKAAMEPLQLQSAPVQPYSQPAQIVVPPVWSDSPAQAPLPELEPVLYRSVSSTAPGIAAMPPVVTMARPSSAARRDNNHGDLRRAALSPSRRSRPRARTGWRVRSPPCARPAYSKNVAQEVVDKFTKML